MIIIGDPNFSSEMITKITKIEDIQNTEPNSTVLFDFDMDILKYCMENDLSSAVVVRNILEVLYGHNLGARYIILSKELAPKAQDLADHYMFDSKILVVIKEEQEIEDLALAHIDGVIYERST
jgi:hypothetical protein